MKLTIDLDEMDFSEFFDESNDGIINISEVLKREIVIELAYQLRLDLKLDSFVKEKIGSELTDALLKYKDQAILKAMIVDVVSKRIDQHNLFFLGEETHRKAKEMLEETLDVLVKDYAKNTVIAAKGIIEEASKKTLESAVLSQYIDYNRLVEDVTRYLSDNVSVTEENKNA